MVIRISTSEYASQGTVVATAKGVIVWRGHGNKLAEGIKCGADTLHIHIEDAPAVQRAFEKGGHTVQFLK